MAEEAENIKGASLNGLGVDNSKPISKTPTFFETNGVSLQPQLFLERLTGKRLAQYILNPIIAIHGDMKDFVFVETNQKILLIPTVDLV